MTRSLPLPSRFFKCPALSAREEQYLVAKAKESAKALVDATRSNDGPVRWADNGSHRGVQMYKGEARHPESVVGDAITYGCGATSLQGSLDEVAAFFDLSTPDKVRDFTAFNGDMPDMQLLYALTDPALLGADAHKSSMAGGQATLLGAHQVTVKWFVIELPSKMIKNRDFLTLECQSSFLDVSGRRGWVRSYHSIKLPSCPDMQAELGLVRGSFYHTGHVFIESERPGFLDVIFSAQVNLKGNLHLPAPLLAVATKKRLSSVADLQKMLTRRRLGAQRFLGDLELVPKSQRKRCHLCSAKFGMLTRKARCRKCGEVVCASACSTVWEVTVPRFGPRKVRVCARCAQSSDPSALEDLPYGSEDSASVTQDDESVLSSHAAGGYHYGQYDASETSSPSVRSMQQTPTHADALGRTHSGHGARHMNGYGRQNSAPQPQLQQQRLPPQLEPRRGRVPSRGDAYRQHGGPYGGEYPYTTSATSAPSYHNANDYESAGQGYGDLPSPQYGGGYGGYDGYDEYPQPPAPAPEPRYEPRYQDDVGGDGFGGERAPPPSAFRQQRALQQQQRVLQQQQQQQQRQLVQRQQQQQELALRQQQQERAERQQQRRAPPPPQPQLQQLRRNAGRQRSAHSGASSGDELDDGDAPQTPQQAALTSSLLAQHTRQMGRPGPVTRPARYVAPQTRRRPAEPAPAPTPAPTPAYPTLTRQQYIEQQRREVQQSFYKAQAPPAPAPPAPRSRGARAASGTGSGSGSGSQASSKPHYQRSVESVHSGGAGGSGSTHGSGGASTREDASACLSAKPQAATTPGQRTLSVTDDEECEHAEDASALSPVTRALADNFSTLLRPEELRSTVESYRFSLASSAMDPALSFCESLDDLDDSRVGAQAQAQSQGAVAAKSTIVQLYQQILELTKQQHALEAQPEADARDKDAVASQLQTLYQKLNQITQDPEVEL